MQTFPLLTTALAERIERNIVDGKLREFGEDCARYCARFGNSFALKLPDQPWRDGVYCFGTDDLPQLNNILEYYACDGRTAVFHLAPMRFSTAVGRALTAAGFRPFDYSQTELYGLPSQAAVPAPSGITIENVNRDNVEHFVNVTAKGFGWAESWRDAAKERLSRRIVENGFHAFLARVDGVAAGAGVLAVRNGIGDLCQGAVDPTLRGRGCHLALVQHRLHAAYRLGCELVVGGADFVSPSFRNQLRAGLRMAYIETTWRTHQSTGNA
jgi:hypothetical protein